MWKLLLQSPLAIALLVITVGLHVGAFAWLHSKLRQAKAKRDQS